MEESMLRPDKNLSIVRTALASRLENKYIEVLYPGNNMSTTYLILKSLIDSV